MSEGATRTRQIGTLARARARRRRTPRHSGNRLANRRDQRRRSSRRSVQPDPFLVERESLRRTVHNGETIRCASETLGPPTSSSSQFQDRPRGSKGGESVVHHGYLALPFEQLFLAPVE